MLLGNLDLRRGAKRFEHTQDIASDNWVVAHNLNSTVVSCDTQVVHIGHNTKILPLAVDIIDANTISVKWSHSMTGTVRIG